MKKNSFSLGLLVLLLMILFVPKTDAQVEKITNYEIDAYLTKSIKNDDGVIVGKDTVFTLTSGIEQVYVTQYSNYIRKVQFLINPEHPIMEFANPIVFLRLTMREDINEDGEVDVITSNRAVLTSQGKLSFIYHYNAKDKPDK